MFCLIPLQTCLLEVGPQCFFKQAHLLTIHLSWYLLSVIVLLSSKNGKGCRPHRNSPNHFQVHSNFKQIHLKQGNNEKQSFYSDFWYSLLNPYIYCILGLIVAFCTIIRYYTNMFCWLIFDFFNISLYLHCNFLKSQKTFCNGFKISNHNQIYVDCVQCVLENAFYIT